MEGEFCRNANDQHNRDLGVIAIVFGSGIVIQFLLLVVPAADPSMEVGNAGVPCTASLLLSLPTLLSGNTLTALCLPRHGFSGSSQLRDAGAAKRLASVCVSLCTLTSLALFWELPRKPYPYVAVDFAADLLVTLLLVFLPVQRMRVRGRQGSRGREVFYV
ncbi:hypothetical protein ABZP36_020999 [Zizania latifolia]